MSIILKGIDLPKHCIECPLEGSDVDDNGFDYWYCKITESMAYTLERPSNCPLIQIPKGHGRLIDDRLIPYIDLNDGNNGIKVFATFRENIKRVPTILEAEE